MAPPRQDICDCGVLEKMADAPNVPIEFDAELNEFHLKYEDDGFLIMYYCPCCGGRMPETQRSKLFHRLTDDELHRLCELTKDMRTVQDVTVALGEPDIKQPIGMIISMPEREGRPEGAETYPAMIYTKVSEIADVHVLLYPNDKVRISFQAKALAKDEGSGN